MSAYDDLVVADGAVAHLPLTESAGPISDDLIGGHAGTWYNAPVPGAAGPIAGETALTFRPGPDGPFVLLASAATLPTFPGPLSWEAWFRMPSDAALFTGVVLSTATRTGGAINRYANLDVASTDQPFLSLAFADGLFIHWQDSTAGDEALAYDGTWHHFVYTCAADGATAIYLDGVARVNDGAPTGTAALPPTAAVIGGAAQNYVPGTYPYVGAFLGGLAHVAVYPLALTQCRVLSHFDLATTGHYTPCPDWVRLSHGSGRGYWQSQGDVTEEWAGGTRRLLLPLPELSATPATLMGRHPISDVPAYCPAPVASTTTVVLPGNGTRPASPATCTQMRCGVSFECTEHLLSLYEQWSRWLNPLGAGVADFSLLLLAIDPFFDELIAGFDLAGDIAIANAIKEVLKLGVGAITGSLFPGLDPDERTSIQRPLFCQLGCAGDVVTVTGVDIGVWHDGVASLTGLPGLSRDLVALLLQFTPLADWQAVASQSSVRSACDAWTCP